MRTSPKELAAYLHGVISAEIASSLMIWGPPGIGKSTIVQEVAKANQLNFIDLRLSQLAPTDLRGLPGIQEGQSHWYPPEFLPSDGRGVLFLDEINMAPPAMQGVAQQLILDRRVGNYQVPNGWYIWAAGNRKEDKAAVFQMPSALANRFLHISVEADIHSFRTWGLQSGISEEILAFLAFRPALLHKIHQKDAAWPSPRTWAMADTLFKAGLSMAPAVGGANDEFQAFLSVYDSLPDIDAILSGKMAPLFSDEPSKRYAVTLALVVRTKNPEQAYNALKWVATRADAEWTQFFVTIMLPHLREKGFIGEFMKMAVADKELHSITTEIHDMILSI